MFDEFPAACPSTVNLRPNASDRPKVVCEFMPEQYRAQEINFLKGFIEPTHAARGDRRAGRILLRCAVILLALGAAPAVQATPVDVPLSLSVSLDRGDDAVYPAGETIVMVVSFNKPVWFRLYHFDAGGMVRAIWPNEYAVGGMLEAGTGQRIPGPRDRFAFRVTAPFGEESILAVASTRPFLKDDPALPALSDPSTGPGSLIPRGYTDAERHPPARAEARVKYQVQ